MRNNLKRAAILLGFVIVLLLIALLSFSPFQIHQGERMPSIQCSIEIDAPADTVYAYLGNSANAAQWSVWIDHITPLNTDVVPDGEVGSLRRCFQNTHERGLRWDEEILVEEQGHRRRLSIFNLVDFPMEATGLATEQIYRTLPGNSTNLTFTVFYLNTPTPWDYTKTLLGAWLIRDIFQDNMLNIKKKIEQ